MSVPGTFAIFETSEGAKIYRLPLEAFPNFWAYVYVIQRDGFRVLVDTGSGTDASHKHLVDGLRQAGMQPSDLTHIFLTHAHIDHYGGLCRLREITTAKIGVHELDVQTVAHHEAHLTLAGRRLASFLAETGLGEETRENLLGIYRLTKLLYQSVPVDFAFEAEEMRLGPFEFIHLPGHSPGHVAIRVDDAVFCGDMVVQGVTPHLSPGSIDPCGGLDHYLASLSRFQDWAKDTRLVLNGHDDLITDLPMQIEATRQNLIRRMSQAVGALREPLTIEEICRAVYGETRGYQQFLVIEKTGAYVEYLYQHGMIAIVNPDDLEQGRPARYQRLGAQDALAAAMERKLSGYAGIRVHM